MTVESWVNGTYRLNNKWFDASVIFGVGISHHIPIRMFEIRKISTSFDRLGKKSFHLRKKMVKIEEAIFMPMNLLCFTEIKTSLDTFVFCFNEIVNTMCIYRLPLRDKDHRKKFKDEK